MQNAFLISLLFASLLLLVGFVLRSSLRLLRVLYIPASVVGGLIGFAILQALPHLGDAPAAWGASIAGVLRGWPTPLICVVFAGLLLERSSHSFGEALRRGARSGLLAWIIIVGQLVIGLAVALVAVRPWREVPASFGQLLEISWAGGHGTSGAMADVYDSLNFPEGRHIAFFLATVGLIYGVVSGLALVNLAIRRGWTWAGRAEALGPGPGADADATPDQPAPAAFARVRGEVIDPLAFQIVILAIAFGVGYALQQGFIAAAGLVVSDETLRYLGNIPLFLFTLLGGWIVRSAMQAARIDGLIDGPSIARLVGVAMEFLIVSAIATMRIDALSGFVIPIVLLVVLAGAWSAFCLLVLARRILPRAYWFELGLLNYGFSTANTPQGFMLLRIVDPKLESGAAEDYAVAAPLSAPFIGGGIVTFAVMPWLLEAAGIVGGLVAAAVLLAALLGVALLLPRRE